MSARKKISKISVVDQITDAIKQDIVDGMWEPGTKIPSEADLAEQFGVNRLSVRLALQKLNTLGIIETRVGEGSFVTNFSLRPVLTELSVLYEDESKYGEVRQLRYLLESECLRIAAHESSEDDRNRLKKALDDYNALTEKYGADSKNNAIMEQLIDADFAFHYQIVRMSHNSLFKDIYYMAQVLIRSHIKMLLTRRLQARIAHGLPVSFDLDTHNRIYRAIVESDEALAKELCEEMLEVRPVKDLDYFDTDLAAVE